MGEEEEGEEEETGKVCDTKVSACTVLMDFVSCN